MVAASAVTNPAMIPDEIKAAIAFGLITILSLIVERLLRKK